VDAPAQLQYAWVVMERLINVFVVRPASAMFICLGMSCHFSFDGAAQQGVDYIESLVALQKNAYSPGYLVVQGCGESPRASDAMREPLEACVAGKRLSTKVLVESVASAISSIYWIIVVLGIGAELLVLGPRRFFMLDFPVSGGGRTKPGRK
jgi:hypothetical protein